jgi:GTP-binding protein HflX
VHALVPYDRGDLINAVHESGHIVSTSHEAGGTAVHAHVNERLAAELAPFAVA